MSDKEKDEGGVVLGGISFGVGGAPTKVAKDPQAEDEPRQGPQPIDLGDVLLPLRVIAVADLVPRAEHNAGANPPETAIRVEPTAFDELFARLSPRCAIEVDSVLADQKVRVDFAPRSMKSFRPDELVRDIPLLRSLMDGRRVLERLRDGSTSIDAAQSELNRLWNHSPFVARVLGGVELKAAPAAQPRATPAAPADDDVMRLLDMVDTGTSADAASAPSDAPVAAPPPRAAGGSKFGAFIAAVAHAGKDRPGARPDQGIALIDKALGLQLGEILQHPEIRRLETAWRGVHFLASRTPKLGVKLEVLSARPEDTASLLDRAIQAGAGIEPPVSFAVVDTHCNGDAASFRQLRALAEVGEANAVPILTNAHEDLLGTHLEAVDRLDNKQALFDAPERAPWRAEANRPAMLWLSLGLNRILARTAYDKRSSRVREAEIAEQPSDERSAAVFIQPCWGVAALAMRSFDKTKWPHRIVGAPEAGILEDLPVREVELPHSGERIAVPTEVFFSTETQQSLARLGILALASQPNSDSAYLMRAATAYVPPPKRTQDGDTAEKQVRYPQTPLVDQLFVARLAQFLRALGSKISAGGNAADVQRILQAALHELFDIAPPPGPELDIDVREQDGNLTAHVTVRPRRFLGVSMDEITLGVPLA